MLALRLCEHILNMASTVHGVLKILKLLREFNFHETSHMRSFSKIKLSQKFQNFQYPMDSRGHVQNVLAQSEREHGVAVRINEAVRNGRIE